MRRDLEDGSLEVGQTLVMLRGRGPTTKADPKTDASAARMGLDPATVAALRKYRARRREEKMKARAAWQDTGLVFTDKLGRRVNPNTMLKRFQRQATAAKLKPCRLHSLRHCYASLLLESGVPIAAIGKRLRHSDFGTTFTLYAHMSEKLDRETAEGGASYLLGGSR